MSDSPETFLVSEESDGDRLDKLLAEALPGHSREFWQRLIKDGCVVLDGKPVTKPAFKVMAGQACAVAIPPTAPLALEPEAMDLDIQFEDADLIVLNKPSGLLTHPAGGQVTNTLVNGLLAHCRGQLSGINGIERPGIVHRLDKDTSGLMMVAKSDRAHRALQAQIQARTAKRRYRAIVQGEFAESSGTVNQPIDRNPRSRERMAIVPTGRHAVTHWQVVGNIGTSFTLLELALETGRTHQIRVHMASLGHPIFGDPLYGTGLATKLKYPPASQPGGQILQAFNLAFAHPVTGEAMAFEIAPDAKFEAAKAFLTDWTG